MSWPYSSRTKGWQDRRRDQLRMFPACQYCEQIGKHAVAVEVVVHGSAIVSACAACVVRERQRRTGAA